MSIVTKARITITIDRELLELAEQAVADGRAKSISAWIAQALEPMRKRETVAEAIDDIMRQNGEEPFTEEELECARQEIEQAWLEGRSSSTQVA